jgi:transposase
LVLLDKGWSCQQVADALLLDDDTIRGWRKLFEQRGIEGITSFNVGGSASYLSVKQEDDLKAWVCAVLVHISTGRRRCANKPARAVARRIHCAVGLAASEQ